MSDDVLIVIPCRMASARFPGKPMALIDGEPLLRWTAEQAKRTGHRVLIASADREIARYCEDEGIPWRPTRGDHPDGTHRCAEVLEQVDPDRVKHIRAVVNWQVDEPCVDPADVVRVAESVMVHPGTYIGPAESTPRSQIATLIGPPTSSPDHNSVKAAVDLDGRCLWFSRASLAGGCYHVGVYAFTPWVLDDLGKLEPTPLALAESLEQLTWIEAGYPIRSISIPYIPQGVNVPEDLELIRHE